MLNADATWCARCATTVHQACLASAASICPTCGRAYDPPHRYFVFSRACPECITPNTLQHSQCPACGAATRWDTEAAYDEFLAHMKDTSRVYLLRGLIELFGGALCLLALVATLFYAFGPLGWFLLGFLLLTTDGAMSIMRSRRIARFS